MITGYERCSVRLFVQTANANQWGLLGKNTRQNKGIHKKMPQNYCNHQKGKRRRVSKPLSANKRNSGCEVGFGVVSKASGLGVRTSDFHMQRPKSSENGKTPGPYGPYWKMIQFVELNKKLFSIKL